MTRLFEMNSPTKPLPTSAKPRYNESAPTEAWNSPQGLTRSSDYGREGLAMKATRKTTPAHVRFWAKVDKSAGPHGCWPWLAAINTAGYGAFHPTKRETVGAHRWALSQALGRPLGPGEFACHRCDNPLCVNPSHLFAGTHDDNMLDMVAKGRSARGARKVRTLRLHDWQVVALRHEAAKGALVKDLSQKYGVSQALISMLCRGDRRSHLGGPLTKRYQTNRKVA